MNIRLAESKDAFALSALLAELGYADTAPFIERRLAQLMIDETERLLIAEHGNTVLGFLSLHFIPQLALAGDFARISYFCIAEGERSKGAGQQLLQHAEQLARQNLARRVRYVTPHFSSLPLMLKQIPALTTVPAGLASGWVEHYGLQRSAVPVSAPDFTLSLMWNTRRSHDPALLWLLEKLRGEMGKTGEDETTASADWMSERDQPTCQEREDF